MVDKFYKLDVNEGGDHATLSSHNTWLLNLPDSLMSSSPFKAWLSFFFMKEKIATDTIAMNIRDSPSPKASLRFLLAGALLTIQVDTDPTFAEQEKPVYIWQALEQPSPSTVFPSSQASPS